MHNKPHTEETKEKIRRARAKQISPMQGKFHSEESKRKMSDSHKGKKLDESHKINCSCSFCKQKRGEFHIVTEETKKKISLSKLGENNPMYGKLGCKCPNWMGGKSFEEYSMEFNTFLKKEIRDRDQHTCQMPGCGLKEKNSNYVFSVHHIDYNKKNNKKNNLITFCKQCHSKTNYNREYWKKLLTDLQNNKRKYNIFFTADTHFFHDKCIEYCKRPFNNAVDMNETLINNYNKVVKNYDLCYFIGDFSFGLKDQMAAVLKQLNGFKILITGSHDRETIKIENLFQKITPLLEIDIYGRHIVLCHYSMRVWGRSHYNSWHLFGHSHGGLPSFGKSFDVGVDSHNFFPWSLDEIMQKMETLPDNFNLIKKS